MAQPASQSASQPAQPTSHAQPCSYAPVWLVGWLVGCGLGWLAGCNMTPGPRMTLTAHFLITNEHVLLLRLKPYHFEEGWLAGGLSWLVGSMAEPGWLAGWAWMTAWLAD